MKESSLLLFGAEICLPLKKKLGRRTPLNLRACTALLISISAEMFFGKCFSLTSAVLPLTFLPSTRSETVDYKNLTIAKGDKLPDFNFCGYHASEFSSRLCLDQQPRPSFLAVATSSALFRALEPGTYALASPLLIRNNTTLRGAGTGTTVLTVSSLSRNVIAWGNQTGDNQAIRTALITDHYVPAVTGTVHLDDVSGFTVGQHVFVQRAVTATWVAAMGMDSLVRNGKNQTCLRVDCPPAFHPIVFL